MSTAELQATIDGAWEAREGVTAGTKGEVRDAVDAALDALDGGSLRVAEKTNGRWRVHQWLKKAVLLSFRLNDMSEIENGPGDAAWWDKIPSKFAGWDEARFRAAGFRAVPTCVVRRSAYVAPGVVLMPSFVNVGAYVDSGTMIDTWSTVGSCAQIGKKCHISAAAQIGGVLEPIGALPVIIEDEVLVGGNSGVYEGTVVKKRAVLGSGTILNRSTPVYDVVTGKVHAASGGEPLVVPENAVVVAGSRAISQGRGREWNLSLYTPVIVKYRDAKTDAKAQLEDLLR